MWARGTGFGLKMMFGYQVERGGIVMVNIDCQ